MTRLIIFLLLALATCFAPLGLYASESSAPSNKILIVHDELPQMEVLSKFLQDKGGLDVTRVEQSALPEDWSGYRAVLGYIHRVLEVPTEKAIIAYTKNGGRYIALHHSISSKKAANEFYFNFLGMHLDNPRAAKNPVMPGKGYGWREGVTLTLVNLNPAHYIGNHDVNWGEEIPYTSSDQPSVEALFPSISLHESEAYLNHKFTDGRQKTVLFGLKFFDDRNDQMFMQDRAGWLKEYGQGEVIYLMPGHSTHDFENRNFSQIILNAINWKP